MDGMYDHMSGKSQDKSNREFGWYFNATIPCSEGDAIHTFPNHRNLVVKYLTLACGVCIAVGGLRAH